MCIRLLVRVVVPLVAYVVVKFDCLILKKALATTLIETEGSSENYKVIHLGKM